MNVILLRANHKRILASHAAIFRMVRTRMCQNQSTFKNHLIFFVKISYIMHTNMNPWKPQ